MDKVIAIVLSLFELIGALFLVGVDTIILRWNAEWCRRVNKTKHHQKKNQTPMNQQSHDSAN